MLLQLLLCFIVGLVAVAVIAGLFVLQLWLDERFPNLNKPLPNWLAIPFGIVAFGGFVLSLGFLIVHESGWWHV